MAIAVNGGHVSRALDFYDAQGKYFCIGGTNAWEEEDNPETPTVTDFRLKDVVGFKKVDNAYLVVPDNDRGTISYRNQKWRIVNRETITAVGVSGVTLGSTVVTVASVAGLTQGAKVRIHNLYEGIIQSISGLAITLDVAAPSTIPAGAVVLAGARVEAAKYVYVEAYLNYDVFPLVTYRQIGLCTRVLPSTPDILKSAAYTTSHANEYTSEGVLEILDNRIAMTRDISMRELLSMIVEF